MPLDALPFDVLKTLIRSCDKDAITDLRLTCRSLNHQIRRVLWESVVIRYDYVSDVLPSTRKDTFGQVRMRVDRTNITELMAHDNGRDKPLIAELLPYVRQLQVGGFAPAPLQSMDYGLLNKRFVDQLFDRLIGSVIPLHASALQRIWVVGSSKYEYITDDSPLYRLLNMDVPWAFDICQTPLTAEFIIYALTHDHLVEAKLLVMSEFLEGDSWLDEHMRLPPSLERLSVEADITGKVKIKESTEKCAALFAGCTLKSIALIGLQLNTQLFRALPDSVRELTITKCQISGSERATVSVDHLVLDTEQEMAPAVTLVADTLERVSLDNVSYS